MAAELILVDLESVRAARRELGVVADHAADADERAAHFTAKKGKRVLGVVSIVPELRGDPGERWRLVGLGVLADERRQGLGSMLVRAARAIAANRGGGLWCTTEDPAAEAFLAGHDFTRSGDALVARLDAPTPADED